MAVPSIPLSFTQLLYLSLIRLLNSLFTIFPHFLAAEQAIDPRQVAGSHLQLSLVVPRKTLVEHLLRNRRGKPDQVYARRVLVPGGRLGLLVAQLIGQRAVNRLALGRVVFSGPLATLTYGSNMGFSTMLMRFGLSRPVAAEYATGIRQGKVLVAMHGNTLDAPWVATCAAQGERADHSVINSPTFEVLQTEAYDESFCAIPGRDQA